MIIGSKTLTREFRSDQELVLEFLTIAIVVLAEAGVFVKFVLAYAAVDDAYVLDCVESDYSFDELELLLVLNSGD